MVAANTNMPNVYQAGWAPDFESKAAKENDSNKFQTHGAETTPDGRLEDYLERDGIKGKRNAAVVSSSDHSVAAQRIELKKGEKIYGFATAVQDQDGRGVTMAMKGENSIYWTTESEMKNMSGEGKLVDFKSSRVDSMGIKDHLALPCDNKVNAVVEGTVKQNTYFTQTKIGSAQETVIRTLPSGAQQPITRRMDGGGLQIHPNMDLVIRGDHPRQTPIAKEMPGNERFSGDLTKMEHNYTNLRTANPEHLTAAENLSASHLTETKKALDKLEKSPRFAMERADDGKIGQVDGIDMHVSKDRDALYSRNPSTGNIQHHVGNHSATEHEAAMYLQSPSQTVQTGGQNSYQAMTDVQRSEGSKFQPEKPRQRSSDFEIG